MYTAKIVNKDYVGGALQISVEFTDGVKTITEHCTPSDEGGFKHWVKSRLATFNYAKQADATVAVNDVIDVTDPAPVIPVQTAEETARDKWLKKYNKWVKIKTTLIDTGILTGDEANLVTLKGKVQSDYLPEYLDLI